MADTYITCSVAGPDQLDVYANGTLVGRVTSEAGPGTDGDTYMTCSSTDPDVLDTYVDGVLVGRLTSETSNTGNSNTFIQDVLGGSTFTEEVGTVGTFTSHNGASLTGLEYKFGNAAYGGTGGTAYIATTGGTDDFYMDGLDMQIDFWIRFDELSATVTSFLGQGAGQWMVYLYGNGNWFGVGRQGVNEQQGLSDFNLNQWYLVTVTKTAANHTRVYIHGAVIIDTDLNIFSNNTNPLFIGCVPGTGPSVQIWNGQVDELRIILGEILNTSNWTPPNTPFYSSPSEYPATLLVYMKFDSTSDEKRIYVDNTLVLKGDDA